MATANKLDWIVYALKCSDYSVYIGITNNLEKRIRRHNQGKGAKYTRARLPVSLIGFYNCDNMSEALKMERRYKKLSHEGKLVMFENRKGV